MKKEGINKGLKKSNNYREKMGLILDKESHVSNIAVLKERAIYQN